MATTTSYNLQKPTVGGSEDSWGTDINSNLDKIDDLLDGTLTVDGIDINSGSIDGTPIGVNSPALGTFTTVTANDVVSPLKGDIKSTDGTVVLDNGTDGTDATFTGAVTGNATTATTLETARALSVSGDIATSAGVDFDGSGAVDLPVTITDALWDKIYPEGSIYATTKTDFDPNNSFYGTWQEYAAGKVLVGHDANDSDFDTVNSATHSGAKTHQLTVNEMPSHAHNTNLRVESSPNPLVDNSLQINVSSGDKLDHLDENSSKSTTTSFKGGGAAHNNLQPYIVVKYWRRTG
jgi:hypothetical protein